MKVELIRNSGSDLDVVNAARVSFDKESKEFTEKDAKLIKYLADHNHFTPFTHCTATLRIKAPLFVARQLFKHQVGLSVNEVSRRYVDTTPEFYWPDKWRKRAENKKQGSSDEEVDLTSVFSKRNFSLETEIHVANCEAVNTYNALLQAGVCPEQARMILPQNMYTEFFWTGSLYAFARVCNLRLQPDAQYETRLIAEQINEIMSKLYPVSWSNLVK